MILRKQLVLLAFGIALCTLVGSQEVIAKDGDKALNSDVRIFAGKCIATAGDYEGEESKAVAILVTDSKKGIIECRFVFFDPQEVMIRVKFSKEKMEKGILVSGKAKDPRGWDIKWTAQLKEGKMTGTYSQPDDKGSIFLKELK